MFVSFTLFLLRFVNVFLSTLFHSVCLFVFTSICSIVTEQTKGSEAGQRLVNDLELETSDYRVEALC